MVNALVVGDKKFISTLAPLVKSCGCSVTASQTLRESLDTQRRDKIDCAIIQERFSDGSGEELMAELKKTSPSFIVVAALRRRDSAEALRWMETGAYECLYEPLNPKDTKAVTRGILKTLSGSFLPKPSFWERLPFPGRGFLKWGFAVTAVSGGLVLLALGSVAVLHRWRRASLQEVKNLPLSFRLPYPNPTGITWDGKNLWISDWSTQTIYKHNIDSSLTLEKFYPMPDIPAVSLAWGDSCLWTVGQDNLVRKHLLDGRLTVLAAIKIPGVVPSCLAWDGRNLWSCDSQSRKIYKHLPDENLSIAASYDFPGKNPVGMVWIGKDLWIGDEGTGSLYRLNFDKDVFTLAEILRPGVHLPGTNKLSGITTDGRNLWTISEGNGLIFRHTISSLRSGG